MIKPFRNALLLVVALFLATMPLSAAQVGDFTLTFNGVQYNGNGTSTWNYTLLWQKSTPNSNALSHFTIALCQSLDGANVVAYAPPGATVGSDGSTGLYGIKWNMTIPENVPTAFSFTLDQWFAVDPNGVSFAAKAGSASNIGNIPGPSLSCQLVNPSIDIEKSCTPAVFVGDTISYQITVTNDGNVTLSDVVVVDALLNLNQPIGTMTPGQVEVIDVQVPAAEAGTIPNTASASGSYFGSTVDDTADCVTTVYELQVEKTASTTFDRDHDWTVTKTADVDSLEICGGSTGTITFTVEATRESTDSGWNATGSVTVQNPAPIDATVTISDELEGYGAVTLNCGVAMPVVIPAGGSVICTYDVNLANGSSRLNTASATMASGHAFTGSAMVEFGSPASETDATLDVAELLSCPEGFICSAVSDLVFTGSGSEEIVVDVTNESAMCDTYYDLLNTISWTDDGAAQSASASVEIYTCGCNVGCTLTIGYWKTHAGFTGNNADRVTQYLPIWLGTPGGAKSVEVTSATQAVTLLSFSGEASNGINKLYAQMLAAKLNIANGAGDADAMATLDAADLFLATHNAADWKGMAKADKAKVLTWMTLLDGYNNGDLGPGHCN